MALSWHDLHCDWSAHMLELDVTHAQPLRLAACQAVQTRSLNFLFSNWLFIVTTWSVLKMSTALQVLRPKWTKCFWCVIAHMNVTSNDPFVVSICHVKWHFIAILFYFSRTWANDFVFLSCMNKVNKFAFTFSSKIGQNQCTCLNLMFVHCAFGLVGLRHWTHQIQCACVGFV